MQFIVTGTIKLAGGERGMAGLLPYARPERERSIKKTTRNEVTVSIRPFWSEKRGRNAQRAHSRGMKGKGGRLHKG